jgi:hypothetical protein
LWTWTDKSHLAPCVPVVLGEAASPRQKLQLAEVLSGWLSANKCFFHTTQCNSSVPRFFLHIFLLQIVRLSTTKISCWTNF